MHKRFIGLSRAISFVIGVTRYARALLNSSVKEKFFGFFRKQSAIDTFNADLIQLVAAYALRGR